MKKHSSCEEKCSLEKIGIIFCTDHCDKERMIEELFTPSLIMKHLEDQRQKKSRNRDLKRGHH